MRSYEAARTYFSILAFCSWAVIVLGVVIIFGGMSAGSQFGGRSAGGAMLGMIPGAALMFLGFLGLVAVQIGRAGVDTAEYTQQMLKIARDQLAVSQQALKQGHSAADGFSALNAAKDELIEPPSGTTAGYSAAKPEQTHKPNIQHEIGSTVTYRGEEIRVVEGGYVLRGTIFPSFERVTSRIDATLPLDVRELSPEKATPAPEPVVGHADSGRS